MPPPIAAMSTSKMRCSIARYGPRAEWLMAACGAGRWRRGRSRQPRLSACVWFRPSASSCEASRAEVLARSKRTCGGQARFGATLELIKTKEAGISDKTKVGIL
jgi:hypothetical protein